MNTTRLLIVAITTMSFACAQAQNALGSTFQLGVYADANQTHGSYHQDQLMLSQGATLNPFSGSLSVLDDDLANPGHWLRVTSAASASWTDAGLGTVAWRNMGWQHRTIASSGSKLNGFVTNGPVWSYTFRATSDAVFALDYDVRGTGDTFGLWGLRIDWTGPGGGLDLHDPYTPVTHGTFTRDVVTGSNYTVGLFNMGNTFTSPLFNTSTGTMDADFNWRIGAVPEPASILALGALLALIVRRRR